MQDLLRKGIAYYREHGKLFVSTASLYYGIVLGVALVVSVMPGGPELQEALIEEAAAGIGTTFPGLLEAYLSNPALAVAYTFLVNLALGSILYITLPGFLLFVLAPLLAFYRAFAWGIIFAPTQPGILLIGLPTILAEGFGYILAVVPSIRVGLSWMLPKLAFRGEQITRKQAFLRGLSELGPAYVIVAIALLIAALVEVGTTQLLILLVPTP